MILFLGILFLSFVSADILSDIRNLQPGEWYEIPNSSLNEANIFPNPIPPGNTGVQSVMTAWGTAVYDTKRKQLLVMGGGHADYSGNEIYAFDMNTFNWSRIWGPSPNSAIGCTEIHSIQDLYEGIIPGCPTSSLSCCNKSFDFYFDGNPSSRHTYHAMEYIPDPYDTIWLNGGSLWIIGSGSTSLYYFNLTSLTWENKGFFDLPYQNHDSGSVYDPITDSMFVRSKYYIRQYNLTDGSMIDRHRISAGWGSKTSAAIDPINRKIIYLGESMGHCQMGVFNIENNNFTLYSKSDLTGNTEIVCSTSPGLEYDPIIGKFIAWGGEPDKLIFTDEVYIIDPVTLEISKRYPSAQNNITPTWSAFNGVFGRFRYIPSLDVYILVNGISENVFIYKLSGTETSPMGYGNTSILEEPEVYSTIYSIGIEWNISEGDKNLNAQATVQYRKQGDLSWKQALPLIRAKSIYGFDMMAGSIFFLEPGTNYEIQLNYNDPDGGSWAENKVITTRSIPTKPNGPVYHVENSVQGGDGSESNPYNITEAIAVAQPGDTFIIHAGDYRGRKDFNRDGEQNNYIVWEGAGDGPAVFSHIRLISADYNWFEGLEFNMTDDCRCFSSNGDSFSNTPHDTVITKNFFYGGYDCASSPYFISSPPHARYWYITDNTIKGPIEPSSGSLGGEGIVMAGTRNPYLTGHIIAHNKISNVADGISYIGGNTDIFGNDIFNVSDDGIEPDYSGPNVRIWGNRISMAYHNGISLQDFDNGMPWYIIGNQIISYEQSFLKTRDSESNFVVYHNTVVNWDDLWLYQPYLALYGKSKNNLFVSVKGGRMWDFEFRNPDYRTDIDYNAFDWENYSNPFRIDGKNYPNLTSYSLASSLDVNSIKINKSECFENLQINGPVPESIPFQHLNLKEGCGAIDKGIILPNINDGFLGLAPDIGAYEFGRELPHYGPRGPQYHLADLNRDLIINKTELDRYVQDWKSDLSISINEVMEAINYWKAGGYS